MDDPELRSDEAVLATAEKIFVKSIPFEGILTNERIILIDRAKNLLPPKKIPLSNVRDIDTGEDKNRDPMLTLSVVAKTGVTRQMVLTFPRQPRGKRNRERDEWVDFIREITSPSPEPDTPEVVPEPEKALKKAGTRGASGSGVPAVPVELKEMFRKKVGTPGASGSGIAGVSDLSKEMSPKKAGTRQASGSVTASVPVQPAVTVQKKSSTPEVAGSGTISVSVRSKVIPPKKAGTPEASGPVIAGEPVQPKVTTPRHSPASRAKDRIHPSRKILEQDITAPPHLPEPVKPGKSVTPAKRTNCPQCGTQVPPGSLFCHECGAKIAPSP
jgi:hypothetical protein